MSNATKTSSYSSSKEEIRFYLNGTLVRIPCDRVRPDRTLVDFLREDTTFKGTKIGCGEGGCGACAVSVTYAEDDGEKRTVSANACLKPLASCDGISIVTADGLNRCCGSRKKHNTTNHPIADRLHKMHGSQCGYCTPGMVMAIYSALKKDKKTTPDSKTMESALDGNICRCTGYRSILDVAKSFASDSKVEDHFRGIKLGPYDVTNDPTVEDHAFFDSSSKKELSFANGQWFRVTKLDRALALSASSSSSSRFLVGDTRKGVYKTLVPASVTIDVRHVPELRAVPHLTKDALVIGAARSLADLMDALYAHRDVSVTFEPLANHIRKIANTHVRNQASIAGNLVMARDQGFLSDLAPILQGAGASLSVASVASSGSIASVTVETFLSTKGSFQDSGDLIVDISIPIHAHQGDVTFATYRSAVRPINCHAILNTAMFARISSTSVLVDTRLVFNGVMAPDKPGSVPVRARKTESFLNGKTLNRSTFEKATEMLCEEIGAMLDAANASAPVYTGKPHTLVSKKALVRGFFTKFVVRCASSTHESFAETKRDLAIDARTPVQSKQEFPQNDGDRHTAAYKPLPNQSAHLQVRGKATYVGDIPLRKDSGYAFVVTTTVANGRIAKIDPSDAMKSPGVIGWVGAEDIDGKNSSSPVGEPYPLPEKAFPQYAPTWVFVPQGGRIGHYGQIVGVVVAKSRAEAQIASKLVKIEYEGVREPVLTIEDGLKKSPAGPCPDMSANGLPTQAKMSSGDVEKAMKEATTIIKGTHRCGSQKHFYIETQSAYAYMSEGGVYQVHSSNQWPQAVQDVCCAVLGVPQHKVNVICRRIGGGYGGKLVMAANVAAIASVASRKLGVAVMLQVDRNNDMFIVGGREEMVASYEVSCDKKTGKIDAVVLDNAITGGHCVSLSWFANISVAQACSEAYYFPNFKCESKMVFTNKPPRSAVRGPGEIQASTLMETVIEHVAHVTGKSPHYVREINILRHPGMETLSVEDVAKKAIPMDPEKCGKISGAKTPATGFTIPKMWVALQAKADYRKRARAVREFNKTSFSKKRGISMIPIRYGVNVFKKTALVNVFKDGTVCVSTGTMNMGQGSNIKIAQCVAHVFGELLGRRFPLDLIEFVPFNSHTMSSQTFTGGSTGTEGAASAAMKAARKLVESFRPILEKLKEKAAQKAASKEDGTTNTTGDNESEEDGITWAAVCAAAERASVPMQALGNHGGEKSEDKLAYNCYGVGCSEIELDTLTGEVVVLRTDIMYDAGKSLNPMVDIGQAEGAFTMGMGFVTQEEVAFDASSGKLLGHGTWEYKPPMSVNTPRIFNVTLLKNEALKGQILSSKASGEPPLVLASSVLMAIRQAITSCHADAGMTDFFMLDLPCTTETILSLVAPAVAKQTNESLWSH